MYYSVFLIEISLRNSKFDSKFEPAVAGKAQMYRVVHNKFTIMFNFFLFSWLDFLC